MRILISVAVLVSLVACGKSDKANEAPTATGSTAPTPPLENTAAAIPTPPATGGKQACAYLSEADASSIIGQPMKHQNDYDDSCEILPVKEEDADDGQPYLTIAFKLTPASTGAYDYANSQKSPTKTAVDGVGDKAVQDNVMPGLVQISVAKGSKSFLITVTDRGYHNKPPTDGAKLLSMAKAAATKVASKL